MNKLLLTLTLTTLSILSYSQVEISDNFFRVNHDTITFFLNENGDITVKSKAVLLRKAKLDSSSFSYSGNVSDYFINNKKTYEASYYNNKPNGNVKCYYLNGNLKYNGYYNNYIRDSIWTFYYDNGNVEKVILYNNNIPLVKEFYKKNGKMVFDDGNGKFRTTIRYGKEPLECRISGRIRNGKMDGGWYWKGDNAHGKEYFKNGEYIKTETYGLNDGYNDPRIISITGYDIHENIAIFDFIAIPSESDKNSKRLKGIPVTFKSKDIETSVSFNSSSSSNQPLKYRDSPNIREMFSNDIINHIFKEKNNKQKNNFWLIIQFSISEDSKIENIMTFSNNIDTDQVIQEFLKSNNNFKAPIINSHYVNCNIYLSILYMDNTLYIPNYRYNNSIFNIFDLLN